MALHLYLIENLILMECLKKYNHAEISKLCNEAVGNLNNLSFKSVKHRIKTINNQDDWCSILSPF